MNTPSSLQGFLAQMKNKQATASPEKKKNLFTMPIYSRYMGNTGMGEDGKLQPNMPTDMLQTTAGPRMIHEGEDVYRNPNGTTNIVPAQKSLARMEKQKGIPGYKTGATGINVLPKPIDPNDANYQDDPLQYSQTEHNDPVSQPGTETDITKNANYQDDPIGYTQYQQSLQRATPIGETARNSPADQTNQFRPNNIPPTPVEPTPNASTALSRTSPVQTGLQFNATTPTPPNFQVNQFKPQETAATETGTQRTTPNFQTNQFSPNAAVPPATTPAETTPATEPASPTGQSYMDRAMARLMDIMDNGSPAQRAAAQKRIDELKASQAVSERVSGFEAAQSGVSPEVAAARKALGRSVSGAQLANTEAQLGIEEMQQRESAAREIAGLAPTVQNMELDRAKYKDTADWKAYETAIAAGDFTTAAAAYQRVTGKPIDMTQMQTYQKYLNTKQEQDVTTGALNITALQNTIGTASWNQMQNMVNDGADLATVNSYLTSQGKAPLTADQFSGILDATPLGERTFNRSITSAGLLLQAGGKENIKKAAAVYNNAFPGLGLDFNNLITEDKAATFSKGMASLSQYVAAGLDYEEAHRAMLNDGTFDMLGLSTPEVEKLYRGLKVNTIDEQWSAISESQWYQGLPAEDQKDMQTFFSAVLSGRLDYSVQKEYTVTAKDGSVTTKYMSSEDAKKYALANKDSTVVATGKTKVVPANIKSTGGGGVALPDVPSGKNQGDMWSGTGDNVGHVYTVGADGETAEVKMPKDTELWGEDANKIIALGETGNPYYKKIQEKRIAAIKDDPDNFDLTNISNLPPDDPVYKAAMQYVPTGYIHVDNAGTALRNPPKLNSTMKIRLPDGSYTLATVSALSSEKSYGSRADQTLTVRTSNGKEYMIYAVGGRDMPESDGVYITDKTTGQRVYYKDSDWGLKTN